MNIVSKNKLDPLSIFDLKDCMQELRRHKIALPSRGPWDDDNIYCGMCQQVSIFVYLYVYFFNFFLLLQVIRAQLPL